MVTQLDLASGNVNLSWSPVNYATIYHVYRSSNFSTLFNPGNVVADVSGTSFTCSGCMLEPATASFFGVIAENAQTPALGEPRDISNLTKADAVQGEVRVRLDRVYPIINEEHAAPNKSSMHPEGIITKSVGNDNSQVRSKD
jgi:hypothetical protein